MRILFAEDDEKLAKMLIHLLKQDGFEVDHAADGETALEYGRSGEYDVLILDWMMPRMDGTQVCRTLRSEGMQTSVIMLTAKDAVEDRVKGLDAGADDYLVKPFAYEELSARLRALTRRSKQPVFNDMFEIRDLKIDMTQRTVVRNAEEIKLSKKEYQLLELFIRNQGRILTREVILSNIWGASGEVSDNNLDAFIRLLRRKLETEQSGRLIVNIRGVGYKLEG